MHVSKEVQGKTLGRRMDFSCKMILPLVLQPADRMVGEQQAKVVLPGPVRAIVATGGMQLADIQVEFALEISLPQLQEGAVQSDEPKFVLTRSDGGRAG